MFSKNIKYIFVVSLLVAIIYPLANIYLVFPAFSKLTITNAEKNAVQIGSFLSETILAENNKGLENLSDIKQAEAAFNLYKVKVFASSGLTLYSTDPLDIGVENTKPYFHEIVAKGQPFTKFAVKDSLSLEGAKVSRDVVETYVPIMTGGSFAGAFEIYQDITDRNNALHHNVTKFAVLSVVLMAVFLLIVITVLLKIDKDILNPKAQEEVSKLQSPFVLLLFMSASLFVTELVIMLLLSKLAMPSATLTFLADSSLLVLLAAPMVYFFVNRPLLAHIAQYRKDQEEISLHYKTEKILKQILHLSIETLSLQEILAQFIVLITSFPWLEVEVKGAVFLVGDDRQTLLLKASHNLHEALLTKCAIVPFGTCLCGKAALTGKTVFTNCLDDDHHIRYEGIAPHGHYCLPFYSSAKELLGVFTLYTAAGAIRKTSSEETLVAASHMLAGVVERKNLENKLEKYSTTDELTGLLNRRGFLSLAERHLQISERRKNTSLLLFADMDNLKVINDNLGHHLGDQALAATGKILKDTFRDSDIVARMGGDEFAVLFTTNVEIFHYPTVVDRIQENVAKYNQREESPAYELSLSIGVAEYIPSNPMSIKELISAADALMYESKQRKKEAAKNR